jgi:hypothetical protein
MTDAAFGATLARLQRRFARAEVRSDLARRVFVLFVGDWYLHEPDGYEPVVLTDYAAALHRSISNVGRAFDRLVAVGWLVEGARVPSHSVAGGGGGACRTFAPGPAWRAVTHPERQSA